MIAHRLVLVTICAVMLTEYIVLTLGLPRVVRLFPEILTVLTAFTVVVAGMQNQFRFVAPKYSFVFGFLAFIMFSGILINQVGTGPIISGMRTYFRAIPFFFLPAVFNFTDEQIKQQMKLLLALALLQVPLAAYQRWIVMHGPASFSGDLVFGTMQISSILSIFLICAVLLIVGLRLRGRIGKLTTVLLCFLLLIPTMINETKGTVILLPVGLFVVLWNGVRPGQRARAAAWTAVLIVGFAAIFFPVYDHLNKDRPYAVSITEFFTERENFDRYMEKDGAGVGTTKEAGRADAVKVPLEYLAREPIRFIFGLGIGNVSRSQVAEGFTGVYYQLFKNIAITSTSVFALEIGIVGICTVFLFYWLIFHDALAVARLDQGLRGFLAIGWTGITVVFAMAMFYKAIHGFVSLSYLFWYISGLMAARRVQLSR